MLKIPFPSALFPITRSPLPTSYLLFPIPYFHLPLPLQVEMGICTEKSKRKSWAFGKQGEAHTVKHQRSTPARPLRLIVKAGYKGAFTSNTTKANDGVENE